MNKGFYIFLQVSFLLSSFVPMLYRFPSPISLGVFYSMQFINVVHLFSITPSKYRQILFYLPSLYILSALFTGKNAVKGMILLLLGIFSTSVYLFSDFFVIDEKLKLFKNNGEKIMFLSQIIAIMLVSAYMFNKLIPIVSIAKNAGYSIQ